MVDLASLGAAFKRIIDAGATGPMGVGGVRTYTPQDLQNLAGQQFQGTNPEMAKQYAADPAVGTSKNLIAEGASTAPVYSTGQGLARVLSGLAGGYFNNKDQAKWGARELAANTALQNAAQSNLPQPNNTNLTNVTNPGDVGAIAQALTPQQGGAVTSSLPQNPTQGSVASTSQGSDATAPSAPSATPTATPRVLTPRQSARAQNIPVSQGGTGPEVSTPAPAVTTGGGSLDPDIVQFFVNKGLPLYQARGIAAGVQAESRSDPTAFNSAGGGSGALGLGQWRGSRQQGLINQYGRNANKSQQLEYLWSELQGGDPGGKSVLSGTDEQSTLNNYVTNFMRPGAKGAQADISRGQLALGGSRTGNVGGYPGAIVTPTAANPTGVIQFNDPGRPTPIDMPTALKTMQDNSLPLPDKVQSIRLQTAANLLADKSIDPTTKAWAFNPEYEKGTEEQQANNLADYQARLADRAATLQSARALYTNQNDAVFANQIADHTLAETQNMQSQLAGQSNTWAQAAATQAQNAQFAITQANNATKLEQQRIRNQGYLLRAQNMPGKIADDYQSANQARDEVDEVQQLVRDNPKAFDVSLAHLLPYQINQRLTPTENYARARVEALQNKITHDLFGSRQTDAEMSRINNMALHILDQPEALNSKLQAMHDGYVTKIQAMEHQYPQAVAVQNQQAWNNSQQGNLPQAGAKMTNLTLNGKQYHTDGKGNYYEGPAP